jgi:uncharacterized protein
MKKEVKIAIPIVIIVIALIVINIQNSKGKVCFSSECIDVEVTGTPEERAKGLMYRTSLDSDKGMLFVFEYPDKYAFWMKNTLIPLDIIWLNENKEVIHIVSAQPCNEEPCPSFGPIEDALYVIEVNAGFAEQNNINIGDKASFS